MANSVGVIPYIRNHIQLRSVRKMLRNFEFATYGLQEEKTGLTFDCNQNPKISFETIVNSRPCSLANPVMLRVNLPGAEFITCAEQLNSPSAPPAMPTSCIMYVELIVLPLLQVADSVETHLVVALICNHKSLTNN